MEVEEMTQEVMQLIDDDTGEMKCKVCGAIHFAVRKKGDHYPPEHLWCIHGCKLEDID
jgi:hypothetical protein